MLKLKSNFIIISYILILIITCYQISYSGIVSYTYDNINRLTKTVYGNSIIEEFAYDAAGNRITHKITISDSSPPSPNPMTWANPPYAIGTSSIAMESSPAIDTSPPISYFFAFLDSPTGGQGGKDSGWQISNSYTNSGLEANHRYGYLVKAKDSLNNETDYSNAFYAYTLIETPTGIHFGEITSTSIQVRSANTPSGLARGSSGLFIENITNSTNSGWKQDNSFWTNNSLMPNTNYSFRAKARNGDAIETAYSSTFSKYTLANVPGSGSFSDVTQTSIKINWTTNGNPPGTMYFCENQTLGTNSGWVDAAFWNNSGLVCGTTYNYRVKAKNAEGIETQWRSLGTQSTAVCTPPDTTPPDTIILSGPSGTVNSGNVSFTFTGSDDVTPVGNLVYATYLQGYDSGWSSFSSATTKSYSNLPDGTYVFYVKAKDEAGNEDNSPATRSFTVQNTYQLSCSDYGIQCVERIDGFNDSNNLANGNPKSDVEFEFRINVQDTGGTPQYLRLFMTQRSNPNQTDFYDYDMTCSGNFVSGATCIYRTILGPAAVHKFYFEAKMSNGSTLRYPNSGYIDGPKIYLLEGKNLVGIPCDLSNTNLDGQQAFGKSDAYRWDSNLGYFLEVTNQKPIKSGEGYFIAVGNFNSTLLEQGIYADFPGIEYKITLNHGWNLISNPYGGNVNLADVKVQKGSGIPVSWQEAVTRGWVVNALYYYLGENWGDTYIDKTAEEGAKLVPWLGYWMNLKVNDDVYSLIIPRP